MGSWSGRKVEDHVVNRSDAKDVQSESSQAALKEKQEGKTSHSHGLGQTSGGQNSKAKEEHPKAPEPIIGMNDERGQVRDVSTLWKFYGGILDDDTDESILVERAQALIFETHNGGFEHRNVFSGRLTVCRTT